MEKSETYCGLSMDFIFVLKHFSLLFQIDRKVIQTWSVSCLTEKKCGHHHSKHSAPVY